MYLENRKPPTIIVTPRISEATLVIGAFGLATMFVCVVFVLGVTCVFGLGVASLTAGRTLLVCVASLRSVVLGAL